LLFFHIFYDDYFAYFFRETIGSVKMRSGRLARSRADRRNTLDCAILNQMIIEPSIDEKARSDKRSMQQQREYERDQKIAMAVNHRSNNNNNNRQSLNFDEHANNTNNTHSSEPVIDSVATSEPKCIESTSRFMSVRSRPVGCRISAPASAFLNLSFKVPLSPSADAGPQTRREFHETFSNLIKLGSGDKQERCSKMPMSREEHRWQTEVKDLIWLELQANMADRTVEQQDKYLFSARQSVGELLREIMSYRFVRNYSRQDSGAKTADSGISSMPGSNEANLSECYDTHTSHEVCRAALFLSPPRALI
jgi:mitogen-activated protein kinase kinase kinase 4